MPTKSRGYFRPYKPRTRLYFLPFNGHMIAVEGNRAWIKGGGVGKSAMFAIPWIIKNGAKFVGYV